MCCQRPLIGGLKLQPETPETPVLSLPGRAGTRPAPSSEGLGRRRGARFAPSLFLWRGRRTRGCRLSPLFTSGRPGGTCCRGPQPLGTPQVSHTWSRLLKPGRAILVSSAAAGVGSRLLGWERCRAPPTPEAGAYAWSLVVLGVVTGGSRRPIATSAPAARVLDERACVL